MVSVTDRQPTSGPFFGEEIARLVQEQGSYQNAARALSVSVECMRDWETSEETPLAALTKYLGPLMELGVDVDAIIMAETKREILKYRPDLASNEILASLVHRSDVVDLIRYWHEMYGERTAEIEAQLKISKRILSPWLRGRNLPSGENLALSIIGLCDGLIEVRPGASDDIRFIVFARELLGASPDRIGAPDLTSLKRRLIDACSGPLTDGALATELGISRHLARSIIRWDENKQTGKVASMTMYALLRLLMARDGADEQVLARLDAAFSQFEKEGEVANPVFAPEDAPASPPARAAEGQPAGTEPPMKEGHAAVTEPVPPAPSGQPAAEARGEEARDPSDTEDMLSTILEAVIGTRGPALLRIDRIEGISLKLGGDGGDAGRSGPTQTSDLGAEAVAPAARELAELAGSFDGRDLPLSSADLNKLIRSIEALGTCFLRVRLQAEPKAAALAGGRLMASVRRLIIAMKSLDVQELDAAIEHMEAEDRFFTSIGGDQ